MSNSLSNKEQNQVIQLSPTQQNCGAAKPTDFKIEERNGGQHGNSKREFAALLAEADSDGKSQLGEPLAERNAVPARRITDK